MVALDVRLISYLAVREAASLQYNCSYCKHAANADGKGMPLLLLSAYFDLGVTCRMVHTVSVYDMILFPFCVHMCIALSTISVYATVFLLHTHVHCIALLSHAKHHCIRTSKLNIRVLALYMCTYMLAQHLKQ